MPKEKVKKSAKRTAAKRPRVLRSKKETTPEIIFDSTKKNDTEALFVVTPETQPEPAVLCDALRKEPQQPEQKKTWWQKLLNIKGSFFSILVGLIFAGFFCTGVYVFATPPASKYTPSETLNPSCTPGSTNCSVLTPVTYTGATAALDLGANNFTTTGTGTFGTSGILGIDAATNTAGILKFWSAGANDFYTTFTAGTQTANATYTLPTAMPSGSSKFLQSTTGGVLSWVSVDLSGYVPYSGATGAVNLGSQNLTTTGTGTFGKVVITSTSTTDGFKFLDFTGTPGDLSIRYDGTTGYSLFSGFRSRTLSASGALVSANDDGLIITAIGGGNAYLTADKLFIDHIGERTSSHGIVFNNNIVTPSGTVISDGTNTSIDPYNRYLYSSAGNLVAQWADGTLKDASGNAYSTSGGGTLAQTLALENLTGGYDIAFNTNGDVITDGYYTSIDPYNRKLYAPDGSTVQLDYSTAFALSLAGAGTPAGYSIFAGYYAGNASYASSSNFFGYYAGNSATNASYSNFFGYYAGYYAANASDSNFLGQAAGQSATSASYSNFLGYYAGSEATSASSSNFFGYYAGKQATSAYDSNFFGFYAGYQATNAYRSNFFGINAGDSATNAYYSNFIGYYAGYYATNASYSNFLGNSAGYGATNASYSNFMGSGAGSAATNAEYSNFIGFLAGFGQTAASYSVFIGSNAGNNNNLTGQTDFVNNLIIDQALLGSGARATAAAIRENALLYGTFAAAAASQELRINASSIDMAYIPGAGNGVTIKMDASGYLYGDSSSLRFKSNIQSLEDGFATILQAQPKSFIYNPTGTQEIGFIAEDFDALGLKDLVNYDIQGLPSGIKYDRIPMYLLEVLKQQQLDIQEIQQRLGITSDNLTVSPAGTVGSGEVSGVAPSSLLDGLKSLGITISNGWTNITKAKITTADISQMQMADKATGEKYCIWIYNGQLQTSKGECSPVETVSEPITPAEPAPAQEQPPVEQVSVEVAPTPEPETPATTEEQIPVESTPTLDAIQLLSNAASGLSNGAKNATSSLITSVKEFTNWMFVEPIQKIFYSQPMQNAGANFMQGVRLLWQPVNNLLKFGK
jgi:hypothetical protein